MRTWTVPLLLLISLITQSVAADDAKPSAREGNPKTGYVDCSNGDKKDVTPILLKICGRLPAGTLTCGQKVSVLERQGPWMKITLPDGIARYIDASLVSQAPDKFVPFDTESGISDKRAPNCPAPRYSPPRVVFAPDPEYTPEARNAHVQGTVTLSLILGVDGRARDIKVEKKLGLGLDQKAVEAVRQWRFEPALRDGEPVEVKLNLEVSFRLYKQ